MPRLITLTVALVAVASCTAINSYPTIGTGGGSTSGGGGASTTGAGGTGGAIGGAGGGQPSCDDDACAASCPPCRECSCVEGLLCVQNNLGLGVNCAGGYCDGGGTCVPCLDNQSYPCTTGEACSHKTCVAPSCTDGLQDGDETDVDCGGACAPCDAGQGCATDADCLTGYCMAAVCAVCQTQSDCSAGYYCSDEGCQPKKATGAVCMNDDECQTGNCDPLFLACSP